LNTTASNSANSATTSAGIPTTARLGLGLGLGLTLLVLLFTVTGWFVWRRKRLLGSSKKGATADRNTGTIQELDATLNSTGYAREKNTRAAELRSTPAELGSATRPVELMGERRGTPVEVPI